MNKSTALKIILFSFLGLGLVHESTFASSHKPSYVSYSYQSDPKAGEIEIRIHLAPNDDGYVVYKLLPTSLKPLGPINIHGRTILDEDDLRIMIMLHLQAGGAGIVGEGESASEEVNKQVNEIITRVKKMRANTFNSEAVPAPLDVPKGMDTPKGDALEEKHKKIVAPKKAKSATYKKRLVEKKKTAKYDVSEHDDAVRLNFGF